MVGQLFLAMARLPEVREILRLLQMTDEALDIYDLHEKYRLSPGQVARAVSALEGTKLISEIKEGFLQLTPEGRKWIMVNRRILFGGEQHWKKVPESFRRRRSASNKRRTIKLSIRDLRDLGLRK